MADANAVATIAASYLASLPPNYAARYSILADTDAITVMLDAAEHGLNDKSCCEAAGLHPCTLQRWHEHAEQHPDSAHAAFADAFKSARAAGKLATLKRIKAASEKPQFWTAGAWMLERTDPEQFALRKDNADVPKVIVQIGAGAGDVKVGVLIQGETLSAFPDPRAPSPPLTVDFHSVTGDK